MIIVPPAAQAGSAGKQGSQFTGTAFPYLTLPSTDGVVINNVSFTPGARTHWHSHENGQILQILAGRGIVQAEGEPACIVRAGDTIWAPPGERHWHGAAPNSYLTHTAISLGETLWMEPVPDNEYAAPTLDEESRP